MYDNAEFPAGRGHEEAGDQQVRHPRRHGGFGGRRGGHPGHGGHGGPGGRGFRRGGPFGGFGPEGFGPGPRRGGPRGPEGPGRGGRRGRRSRGDVRTAVLALLAEQPMHGYQIIQEIGERSGGAWRPSPGSVYPTVSQLSDEGLVRTEKAEGRSVVHLTESGEQYVAEHSDELDAVWSTAAAEDGFESLRASGRGLAGAVRQVAEVGTPDQVADAVRLLDETRRRLYLLLAGQSATTDGKPQDAADDSDTDE